MQAYYFYHFNFILSVFIMYVNFIQDIRHSKGAGHPNVHNCICNYIFEQCLYIFVHVKCNK